MSPRSAPIVLVCGWLNGNHRGVGKYAQLYTRLGYKTMILTSNASHLVLPPSWIHSNSIDFLMKQSEELILVPHMISNGGCISWYSIQQHLEERNIKFKVPAMILDSAPTVPRNIPFFSKEGKKELERMTQDINSPLKKALIQECIRWGWASVLLRWRLAGEDQPLERNYKRLILQDIKIPKLFLYSRNDSIVPSSDVEVAIERAQALGTLVESFDFKESNHVQHILQAPEQYETVVRGFLDRNNARSKRE